MPASDLRVTIVFTTNHSNFLVLHENLFPIILCFEKLMKYAGTNSNSWSMIESHYGHVSLVSHRPLDGLTFEVDFRLTWECIRMTWSEYMTYSRTWYKLQRTATHPNLRRINKKAQTNSLDDHTIEFHIIAKQHVFLIVVNWNIFFCWS